jgi:hypothetical protein
MSMARRVNRLIDMEIDEISLVDIPAAPGAKVAIAKRATEEDHMPEIFDKDGNPVDPESLELGDQVFDAEGNAFEVVLDDEPDDVTDEYDDEDAVDLSEELELVGKRFADDLRTELSKAVTDIERDEVVSKALGRAAEAELRAQRAEQIAKSEQTIRLEREYVEVAKRYNIPADPNQLGPVLMRMAETMSDDDCRVIHKALSTAGSAIFDEIGLIGGGDNADPMAQVDAAIDAAVAKSATAISKAEATEAYFLEHPEAYDEYLRAQV